MARTSSITTRSAATVALLCALTPAAYAGTVYVANNGADSTFCGFQVIGGFTCGAEASPCRSITCAIKEAEAGDTVLVGPGRYSGDLDRDGVIGERGEETPSAGCGCMLSVNKAVILVSSDGAAATVIDAESISLAKNVLLILNGGEFGRLGRGFTVTHTKDMNGQGIVIDSTNVKVRGNQVIGRGIFAGGSGITTIAACPGPILIEGNQVIGWTTGITALAARTTVRKNKVLANHDGINAYRDSAVVGNIISGNDFGMTLIDMASAVGNALYGNAYGGIEVNSSSSGAIARNNLVGNGVGNGNCGVINEGVSSLNATNNYWGAVSGPGPDPADQVCNDDEGTTTVTTPFATTPFIVKAPIKP